MKNAQLLASLIGLTASHGVGLRSLSEPSEAQKRMARKREASASQRAELAREIAEWNANVKRRNQAFATTGKCRDARRSSQ